MDRALLRVFVFCFWCIGPQLPSMFGLNVTIGIANADISSTALPRLTTEPFCKNGGTLLSAYSRICKCLPGFKGTLCHKRDCVYGFSYDSASCTCTPGWSGTFCDVKCEHGSVNSNNRCECHDGWKGETCNSIVCVHGNSKVFSSYGDVYCHCNTGWQGPHCDTEKTAVHTNVNRNSVNVTSWIVFLVIIAGILVSIGFCCVYCLRKRGADSRTSWVAYPCGQPYVPSMGATTNGLATPAALISTHGIPLTIPTDTPLPMRHHIDPPPSYEEVVKGV